MFCRASARRHVYLFTCRTVHAIIRSLGAWGKRIDPIGSVAQGLFRTVSRVYRPGSGYAICVIMAYQARLGICSSAALSQHRALQNSDHTRRLDNVEVPGALRGDLHVASVRELMYMLEKAGALGQHEC